MPIPGISNPAQIKRPGIQGQANPGVAAPVPGAPPQPVAPRRVPPPPTPAIQAPAAQVPPAPAPVASVAPVANVPSIGVPAEAPPRQHVGFFEQGGVKTPIYHDQLAAGPVQPGEQNHDPYAVADYTRNAQAQHAQRQMDNLVRKQSSLYDYNHLPDNAFTSAMQAYGGQAQTLAQAQANIQATDIQSQAQFGSDPHRDPAYRQALIQHLGAQDDRERAHAGQYTAEADAAAHPERQLDLLRRIAADPAVRGMYLAGRGADPATIASIPSPIAPAQPGVPAINAANFGQHLGREENASMKGLLESPDMSLLERTKRAAQFPGFTDLQNPSRQLYDQWLKSQYTDPQKWGADTYVPENPDNSIPVLGRVGGLVAALYGSMPWAEGHGTGTGFNWHKNYAEASELQNLIQKHRISPY